MNVNVKCFLAITSIIHIIIPKGILTYVFLEALQYSGHIRPPPEFARPLVLRQVHEQPRPQSGIPDPPGELPVSVLPALRHVRVLPELNREHRVEEVLHVPLGGVGDVKAPVDRRDVDDGEAFYHIGVPGRIQWQIF